MAKKHWSLVLGFSLMAGVASSLLLRKNKQDTSDHIPLQNNYQGTWWYIDQQHQVQHSLKISADFSLQIDGRDFPNELLELSPERLVLRDQYGYHLIINCHKQQPIEFYDEANDCTYHLEKKEL